MAERLVNGTPSAETQNSRFDRKPWSTRATLNDGLQLLAAVRPLLTDFISRGDSSGNKTSLEQNTAGHLVDPQSPENLARLLQFSFPQHGLGQDGFLAAVEKTLQYSVNTWHQGFLSKLYASPNPVGVISELVLAVLNTNVHVYQVSPALTVVEKAVGKALAELFGLAGEHAGGLSQQGGSAANLTALVIARNSMFPEIKTEGSTGRKLVLFTSSHGHYSFEQAAQVCGLGSKAVWPVPVDEEGRMRVSELERLISRAKDEGYSPFFVNATAGTTVLGSYDPMTEIGEVCKRHGLWFHVDASWGGAVVFSSRLKHKMRGAELAQSVTYNPHKMLNVPVTCSFLLVADLRQAWRANTLPASYLFHDEGGDAGLPDDLADMTLQCGRKGDALKLALSWIYYGTSGFEAQIERAFVVAAGFAEAVAREPDLRLVSTNPPPCLQVCFYSSPSGRLAEAWENSRRTRTLAKRLVEEGFSVDFASGEEGMFLRVVVNLETREATVQRLMEKVVAIGHDVAGMSPAAGKS